MVRRRGVLTTVTSGVIAGSLFTSARRVRASHDEYPNRGDDDRVWLVDADPEYGFNFPYWVATPETVRPGPVPILVEVNNARRERGIEDTSDLAWSQIWAMQGSWLSEELGVPMLVPVFPWPHGDPIDESHSTTLLDRETMLHEGTDYEHLDLQLLRMVEHASREELTGIDTQEQVLFYGNSSGGVAGERMAMMHPDRVLAVAGGGLNGILTLPLAELGEHTLNYPVGVADIESISGAPFDAETVDSVDRFFFHGGTDDVDRLPMDSGRTGGDFTDPEVLETAQAVYGPDMVRDRFPRCHVAFEKAGITAQFRVYPEMGHNPRPASHDILEFFRKSLDGEDVSNFGQRLELDLDIVPTEVLRGDVPGGVEVDFEVSGSNLPPQGLVDYRWDFDDGSSGEGLRVTNTFREVGTHKVTLTTETPHGQHAEETTELSIESVPTPTRSPTPNPTSSPTATEAAAPGPGVLSAMAGIGSGVGYLMYRSGKEDSE